MSRKPQFFHSLGDRLLLPVTSELRTQFSAAPLNRLLRGNSLAPLNSPEFPYCHVFRVIADPPSSDYSNVSRSPRLHRSTIAGHPGYYVSDRRVSGTPTTATMTSLQWPLCPSESYVTLVSQS